MTYKPKIAGIALVCSALGLASMSSAMAQSDTPTPPAGAVKLSQIVALVEARDGFQYIDEVDWNDDGYVVTYYTADKAKVEITYDPVTGKPK